MCLLFQRGEIIYSLAELLTEKKDEILSANRKDLELATASGTESRRKDTDKHNPQPQIMMKEEELNQIAIY